MRLPRNVRFFIDMKISLCYQITMDKNLRGSAGPVSAEDIETMA